MLFLLFITPILFNLTGVIDTYLTKLFGGAQEQGNLESSSGTLMIIGGFIALLVSVIAYIFLGNQVFEIGNNHIYILLFSGILYGFAARPYFQALKREKIENIIPFLQVIPLFTYIVAKLFLGETLSTFSILLMIATVITTGLFSRDFNHGKFKIAGFLFTCASAELYSSSYISFKFGGGESVSLWAAFFWQHIGVALSCLIFLYSRNIRLSTWQYFKTNGVSFSVLNVANEAFFIIAMLIENYLILDHNASYINTIISGLQPIFGFLMIYIAYRLLPRIYTREYSKKQLLYKSILCFISFGLLYMFYSIQ